MAITKQARNITITVKNNYQLFVGDKLEKITELLNIEATNENLTLGSSKKITSQGNK